jgi:GntR family transcriptional regulator, transcriptional repressor for pyruvate dehydrogenase complex
MLRTLQPQRLSDGVVTQLLEEIRAGRLHRGQRLPSERELSEQLGVSRVSVREGLRMLELLEVIEVKHGRGAFVVSADVRPSGRLLRHWLRAHRDEVFELLEVREALEGTAAASAAERGAAIEPPEEVDAREIELLVAKDLQFHNAIATAAGNPVLASLIAELNGILEESRFAMFAIPGRPQRSHADHLAIEKAIRERDPERARQEMHMHISQTRSDIATLSVEQEGD